MPLVTASKHPPRECIAESLQVELKPSCLPEPGLAGS